MAGSRSFKDLVVWQRSMELVREVYRIARAFPKHEDFALGSQMRRCAVSIPSNISEGSKRGTHKDFAQFLRIAAGSSAELETQLLIAKDEYPQVHFTKALGLLDEVQRMLTTLTASIHN